MKFYVKICIPAFFVLSCAQQPNNADYLKVHQKALLADIHNDAIYTTSVSRGIDISARNEVGDTDLDRLKDGGVGLQVFVLFCDGEYGPGTAFSFANRMADSLDSVVARNPDKVAYAHRADDVERITSSGKIAALMAVEGGHMIEDRLDYLDSLYRRGMKYLTLTWNNSTTWATSAADETDPERELSHKGLTRFGEEVVKRLNELGVMIDLSHAGEQTFYDVLRVSSKPVMATHSNCYALAPHPRNLKDEQIKAIKENGGLIGVNFYSGFIDPDYNRRKDSLLAYHQSVYDSLLAKHEGNAMHAARELISGLPKAQQDGIRPPLSMMIDHIDHIVELIGVDHVAIGSDFDGAESFVGEMDDVSSFPKLTKALLERGYSEADVLKILGGNFMRVFRANQSASLALPASIQSSAREANYEKYGANTVSSVTDYLVQVEQNPEQALVDLRTYLPGAQFEVVYATNNNFMRRPVYTQEAAYLRLPAAKALQAVQAELKQKGYGLKIWDAYRPYGVTVAFYEEVLDSTFVASPYTGSRHNRGCAVDLTLVDLSTGKELPMPTGFDDFVPEAHVDYAGLPEAVIANRELLKGTMTKHGFDTYPDEWWHYDFNGWEKFPLMDLTFEELEETR